MNPDAHQAWRKTFLGRFESIKATIHGLTREAADKSRQYPKAVIPIAHQLRCLEEAFSELTKPPVTDHPEVGDYPSADFVPAPRPRGGRAP